MEEEKKRISPQQILITIVAVGYYSSMALSLSIVGPTLVDLQIQLQSDLDAVSFVFTVKGIAALIASLVLGPLFDYVNNLFLVGLIGALASVFLSLALWTEELVAFLCLIGPTGIFEALTSIGVNLLIAKVWKDKAEQFFQVLNFSFALSFVVGPLLAKPFLQETDEFGSINNGNKTITNITDGAMSRNNSIKGDFNDTIYWNTTTSVPTNNTPISSETLVQNVYFIIAGYILFWSLACLVLFCRYDRVFREESKRTSENKKFDCFAGLCCIIFFCSMFFAATLETCYAGFLLTFVVEYLGWSKSDGVYVTLVFSLGKLAASILAIFAVKKIKPRTILLVDILVCMVASIVFVSTVNTYEFSVWICSAVIGLGQGNMVPINYAFAFENGLVENIGGKFSSIFWAGFFTGYLAAPPVLGYLFKEVHPMYFVYTALAACVGMLFTMLAFLAVKSKSSWFKKNKVDLAEKNDKPSVN